MKSPLSIVLGPVITTVALVASPVGAQAPPPLMVRVAVAEKRDVDQTMALVATVEPNRRAVLGAEVAGLVADMPVRQGDTVEEGQVVCRLRDVTLRFSLREQEARLERLRAELDELEAGTRQEDLDRLRAARDEAKALLQRWEFEKQRVDRLYEGTRASDKEYHDVYAEYNAARERLAQAEAAYSLAKAGPRQEVIAAAQHALSAQEAVVARVSDDLAKTEIKAPFKGSIAQRFAEVGEWVTLGGNVVELIELDPVLVRVDVPQTAIPYVLGGDEVRVHVDALRQTYRGTVKHVMAQADLSARTFPVEIELPNPEWRMRAGMSAHVIVPSGAREPSVVIPKDAVVERDGVNYAALVSPGPQGLMGIPIPVTLGAEAGESVAVTSGNIPAGAQVVTRGNEQILFPRPVTVEGAPPPSATSEGSADQPSSPPAAGGR
jgi:multidrug efflux pump subunit AcrA (membrane-fusion protein)